jgi:hypothetical protein
MRGLGGGASPSASSNAVKGDLVPLRRVRSRRHGAGACRASYGLTHRGKRRAHLVTTHHDPLESVIAKRPFAALAYPENLVAHGRTCNLEGSIVTFFTPAVGMLVDMNPFGHSSVAGLGHLLSIHADRSRSTSRCVTTAGIAAP